MTFHLQFLSLRILQPPSLDFSAQSNPKGKAVQQLLTKLQILQEQKHEQKPTQHCKTIFFQLKTKFKKSNHKIKKSYVNYFNPHYLLNVKVPFLQTFGNLRMFIIHFIFLYECSFQIFASVQFSSVIQSCLTLCNPMNRSMTGVPVHHQLQEFTQTHIHQAGDAIQPSHPL